ncbi:unnamed protein product [Closterium sp. Naga37s-1]|nr:unnamed protein product [Closterium sp. Naga37s-1]
MYVSSSFARQSVLAAYPPLSPRASRFPLPLLCFPYIARLYPRFLLFSLYPIPGLVPLQSLLRTTFPLHPISHPPSIPSSTPITRAAAFQVSIPPLYPSIRPSVCACSPSCRYKRPVACAGLAALVRLWQELKKCNAALRVHKDSWRLHTGRFLLQLALWVVAFCFRVVPALSLALSLSLFVILLHSSLRHPPPLQPQRQLSRSASSRQRQGSQAR